MTYKIRPKRSNVASKVPLATDLDIGELAINMADQKIYTKTPGNTVVELGGGGSAWADITGKPTFANVATSGSYTDLSNLPTLFSGSYTDLTSKPTLVTNLDSLTDVTITSAASGQVLKFNGTAWINDTDSTGGGTTLPADASGYLVNDGTGALSWAAVTTNEITNTDGIDTFSVSVGTDGVVTMTTSRGGLEFGALPEPGGPTHFHIMRPAGESGSGGTDLFFGDDYNYVLQRPASYNGSPAYGVEIGANDNNGGTQHVWRFETDGDLVLPAGGDIKDSTGTSVLGGGSASTGNITFSGDNISGSDNAVRIRSLNTTLTASYSFNPSNSDYSTAVWDGTGITFNDPTQAIYDALWALTSLSTIQVQVGSTWFTVTSSGSSTPGMPQAPTLWLNQTAVDGPLNIDVVDIDIRQGTESYVEIDGTDFRVDVQDDIRIYGNDVFLLSNRSTSDC